MQQTSTMPSVTLGRTGITTSRLGLGAWGLGNTGAHPGALIRDEETVAQVLDTALSAGVRLLDSAEVYDNEELLGRLLRSRGDIPEDLVVSTKFGHGKGFSGDQVRRSVERSLAAFGIESIPVMMLHDPRGDDDLEVIMGKGGALEALRELQDQGLVGSVGLATGTLGPLQRAVASDEFDVIQFPRLFTLLNQAARTSGLLEQAKEKNIGTILTSPFTGNILGTGVRGVENPLYSFWPAQPEVVAAVAAMQERAGALGIPLPEAAVAYAAAEPLIDVIVIGVTSVAELRQDIAALSSAATPEQLESIAAAGKVDQQLLGGPDFVWPFPLDRMPPELKAKLG
jgi:D-threo-aldose 1-dehydrogenase